jgi:hypothetical protein
MCEPAVQRATPTAILLHETVVRVHVGRHDVDIGGLWFAIQKFSLRARSPDLVPRRSASVRPHIAVRC